MGSVSIGNIVALLLPLLLVWIVYRVFTRAVRPMLWSGGTRYDALPRPGSELFGEPRASSASSELILAWVLAVGAFMVVGLLAGQDFSSGSWIETVLQRLDTVIVLGTAQAVVMLCGRIDLSVGAVLALSSSVMGVLYAQGLPPELALLAGLAAGAACGLVNGLLVVSRNLNPYLATVLTWQIFGGLAFLWLGTEPIMMDYSAGFLNFLGVGGISGLVVAALPLAIVWYVLGNSNWGRRVRAAGEDRSSGQHTDSAGRGTVVSAYVLSGVLAAVAAWMTIEHLNMVSPYAGQFGNFQSLAVVLVGGIALSGGRGSILGVIPGSIVVVVISTGVAVLGVSAVWGSLSTAAIVLIAVVWRKQSES
jgi:fructose transport system permease protein